MVPAKCDLNFKVTDNDSGPELARTSKRAFCVVAILAAVLSACGLALATSYARITKACCLGLGAFRLRDLPNQLKRCGQSILSHLKLCCENILDDDDDLLQGCALQPLRTQEGENPLTQATPTYAPPEYFHDCQP